MKFSRGALIMLLLFLSLTLTGCRKRIVSGPAGEVADAESTDAPPWGVSGASSDAEAEERSEAAFPSSLQAADDEGENDPGAPTQEDPQSDRRAYAQDAPARSSAEAGESIEARAMQGAAGAQHQDGAALSGSRIASDAQPDADKTFTEIKADDNAAKYAADDAGVAADSVMDYYAALLSAQLGTLFECHRLYVYFECEDDYQTVNRMSEENQLILDAGAYNAAAKRKEGSLVVTDEWVIRKNPGAIVKCVGADVLGDGVLSDAGAKAVYDALLTRPGWAEIDAVKNRRVILISRQLLQTEAGRMAAALHLAKRMYPDLLAGCDADQALGQLLQESSQAAAGLYTYTE